MTFGLKRPYVLLKTTLRFGSNVKAFFQAPETGRTDKRDPTVLSSKTHVFQYVLTIRPYERTLHVPHKKSYFLAYYSNIIRIFAANKE